MVSNQGPDHGTSFVAVCWSLTSIALCAVFLRLYTRLWVTRSAGSDDVAIVIAAVFTIFGCSSDSIQNANGLGRHTSYLDENQMAQVLKWEYIVWTTTFLNLFFIRSSVMLFTLRLLPITKIWPQRVILATFLLNFAITLIAVVTYGARCVPFKAIYENVPKSKCESPTTVVTSQRLNGILACIIDISTASIPAFLLFRVQIRRVTKIILNVIFFCGLVTAALSIGRAVTTNTGVFVADNSWRTMPSAWFAMIEENLGITFACCPALRQLFAYYAKTRSFKPPSPPHTPNEDFIRMRRHVNLRDIFWYSQPQSGLTSVVSGGPVYPPEEEIDREAKEVAEEAAKRSPMDILRIRTRNMFAKGSMTAHRRSTGDIEDAAPPLNRSSGEIGPSKNIAQPKLRRTDTDKSRPETASTIRNQGWPGLGDGQEVRRIARNYRVWGLQRKDIDQGSEGQSSTSFLRNDSDETLSSSIRMSSTSTPEPRRFESLNRNATPAPAIVRQSSGRSSMLARAAANSSRSPPSRPLGHIIEQDQSFEDEQQAHPSPIRTSPVLPSDEQLEEDARRSVADRSNTSPDYPSSSAADNSDNVPERGLTDRNLNEEESSSDSGLGQSIRSSSNTSSARQHPQGRVSRQKAKLVSIPARPSMEPE